MIVKNVLFKKTNTISHCVDLQLQTTDYTGRSGEMERTLN
jgi:hypothetical protein